MPLDESRGLSRPSQTRLAAVLVFDRVAAIPRSFDFRQTLVAVVTILDAVAISRVPLDLRQTVRPLVRILDRVALRGARHRLPHPDSYDRAERHEEVASCYVADGHAATLGISEPQCLQRVASRLIVSAQYGQVVVSDSSMIASPRPSMYPAVVMV